MGKQKKQRNKCHKESPIVGISVQEKEDENLVTENASQAMERIMEQLQSIDMEEKLNGIQTLEAMGCDFESANRISKSELVKTLGPLLIDASDTVRAAAASTFRTIADNGGEETVANLLKNDIITPLATLLKRHYSSWRPNTDGPSKIKNILDHEKETFLQAVSLLWTLAEKSDMVLKRSEEEDLLSVLLPFLNTQIYDLETSIVAIQCILTLSEENLTVLDQIKSKKEEVFRLLELEPSDSLNEAEVLMLRTLASGLVVNIFNGFSNDEGISLVGKCLTVLSKTLECNCDEKIEKVAALLEKEVDSLSHKTQKKIQELKVLANSQVQAVEILANLCTEQESSDDESEYDQSDSDNMESDDRREIDDEIEPMNEESFQMDSNLCIEAIEVIVSKEMVKQVLSKTKALPKSVEKIFETCDEGQGLLKRLHTLRCRSFLCLTNLMLNLSTETLGGVDYLFRIWTETGKLVFNEIDPKNTELLDAATSTMRSALQKINESQTNPFQQLTLADIQPMLNGERQSPSSNVRANLINILGSLSLILVKSDLIHTGDLVKNISEFLLNTCMSEAEVWVIAEALDTIMDIFAEDETDQMALEINLVPKLTTISSILHTKFRQQKQTLGSNIAIVSTVKVNLKRFLRYKGKRVSMLHA